MFIAFNGTKVYAKADNVTALKRVLLQAAENDATLLDVTFMVADVYGRGFTLRPGMHVEEVRGVCA